MTISSLFKVSTPSVNVQTYKEAPRWLQERAAVSGGTVAQHKAETEKLLACCAELGMSDVDVLAFCKVHIEKALFWIEWEIYAESGTPDLHHQRRCAFVSNLVAGRPTAMLNLQRAVAH